MKSRFSLVISIVLLVAFAFPATAGVKPAEALSACDWAQFVADVTVPDGTSFAPNTAFTKTWRLKNIGNCTWTTAYALVFDSGSIMGGPGSMSLPGTVSPGQTVDISVGLTAPASAGHYIGYWKLRNASGALFGIGSNLTKPWWVEINVSGSSGGAAYDFASNYCSASWFSIQGSLPCPGTDGDSRGFVLKVDNPRLENGIFDTGSGLITNPQASYNGDIHGEYPAFRVQHGDRFQSTINCAFGATSCYVTFRLDYRIGNGPIGTLWSFREKYEGLYFRTNLDLSSLAGSDVKFILTVLATGPASGDRALWSNPMIVRQGGPPPPPPPGGTKFDFGTGSSPVASGYAKVTETTAYASGGFGWTSTAGLESRDRGAPADDLKRDFVMHSSAARTFKADLPNGNYAVTVTMGDNDFAHDNMVVKANGATVLGDVDAGLGAFAVNNFNVSVGSGSLSLEFSDAAGADPTWVVNAVSINPSSPPPPYGCDRAQFIADLTVPDGTTFAPNTAFNKTWRLKNVGTCTWTTSYKMIFDTGDKMGGPDSVNMPMTVHPGQVVDLTVGLTAPNAGGPYRGYWKFQNSGGVPFGIGTGGTKSWWVDIWVSGPTATPSPPAGATKFDFGTGSSPVASGYAKVTETTAYASGGFGWTSTAGLESRDRGAPADDLKRDFVMHSSAARTFKADLPNGNYAVTVTMGDNDFAHDNMVVKANGATVLGDVDAGLGAFAVNNFNVSVGSGSLSLEFSDAAGADPTWVVNAVSIVASGGPTPTLTPTPTTTPAPGEGKFDFGTDTSPVAAGFTKVTETTAYAGAYGWTSTTSLESRDRSVPDDRRRDFVMSSVARIFKVALPNGIYSVTITMGDQTNAHDNMRVTANGTVVSALSHLNTAAAEFKERTFSVPVEAGFLELEFADVGGTDPNWVVNSVTMSPAPLGGTLYDFGTGGSPVAGGSTGITEATLFSPGGFGWNDTTGLDSRDRGAPDDLRRDFVFGALDRVFKVTVPDGLYSGTITMGDQTAAHDNMVVRANGELLNGDVDSAAGAFTVIPFIGVSVSGGTLQLEFSDAGGADPNWIVNAVTILP